MSKIGFSFFLFILLAVCGVGVFFYEKEVNIIRQQLAQQQQEIELAQTSNIMLEEKLLKKGIIEIIHYEVLQFVLSGNPILMLSILGL